MPRRLVIVFLLFSLASTLFACATTKKEGTPSSPGQKRASHYDFEDILIPSELTLEKKDSFVYTTQRFKAGILTFSGRVEPDSLTEFFKNNMTRDGWKLISTIKFRETMLVFLKDERACVITIKEKTFSTTLEVRVGPIEQASSQVKGSPSR